jgi:hypothetical protein
MARKFSTGLRNALLGKSTGANGSLNDLLTYGIIDIYSGSQPTDADAAETGTKLVRITAGSGAFTPETSTNGLEFNDAASAVLSKKTAQVWSGVGLATGTAGWFRFYDNDVDTGSSTSAVRLDGSVGLSGAQLTLSTTSIESGATITVDSCSISMSA